MMVGSLSVFSLRAREEGFVLKAKFWFNWLFDEVKQRSPGLRSAN